MFRETFQEPGSPRWWLTGGLLARILGSGIKRWKFAGTMCILKMGAPRSIVTIRRMSFGLSNSHIKGMGHGNHCEDEN